MNRVYGFPIWLAFALLVLAGLLAGCGTAAGTAGMADGKWKVTATTGMVADIVRNVGGDRVAVTQLMGPGVDPHLYKASHGDIKRIERADVVFYSGLHLEGKMTEILEKMAGEKNVVAVTSGIPENLLISDPQNPGQYDPHVWFDVTLWMKAAETVRDTLMAMDPAHREEYQTNADRYLQELAELDRYARERLASIPRERRVLVTAHDAFAYFGRAYDVEVVGLQGLNTASEYGLKDVQKLIDLLVARRIHAVFVESSVPQRSIEAVVEGARAQGHTVHIGGELFSDAMGQPGTPEGTYVGMVKHNVDTIAAALK